MAKLTKAMQIRLNGHKLGEYDSFMRAGEIIVGQLCQIDIQTGHGLFRGYVLNDTLGEGRGGQERHWKVDLRSKPPSRLNPRYIIDYENFVGSLPENAQLNDKT